MSEQTKRQKEAALSEDELGAELEAADQLAEELDAEAQTPSEAIAPSDEVSEAGGTAPIIAEEPQTDAAEEAITAAHAELKPVIEALLFVAEEPIPLKQLCKILGQVAEADVYAALIELIGEYEAREGGLEIREIAGGWRISTR